MRRRLAAATLLAGLVVALFASPAAAQQRDEDLWTVEGGGWGHGVGLSQYGAYSMAAAGHSAADILAFYYSGASATGLDSLLPPGHWILQPEALWVGLEESIGVLDVGVAGQGGAQAQVCQPSGTCAHAQFRIGPGEPWRFEAGSGENAGRCRFRHVAVGNNGWGPCDADVSWADDDGATRIVVQGRQHAHGRLRLRPAGDSAFHAVLSVGLEDYLYGLAEVPSSWPEAALEAQATIGRGYAVATALGRGGPSGAGRLSSCGCHLRSDTRDQAYNGWAKENEISEGVNVGQTRWKPAVDRTGAGAGHLVVTHPQAPGSGIISAYYSSSNGGASEDNEDVWGGQPLPWLRSVEDPWSLEPANPLARWTVYVREPDIRARLCAAGYCWDRVVVATMRAGPPGAMVRFFGTVGGAEVFADLNGSWVRGLLGAHGWAIDADGRVVPARASPYVISVDAPVPFIDIVGNLHYSDIFYIADRGITRGCDPPANELFCPTAEVTREQMASFLVRALDLPAGEEGRFRDAAASVHSTDIAALAAAGITRGCNPPADDLFCPGRPVTRGEMAAFLVRAFRYAEDGGGDLFADDDGSVFEGDIDRLGTSGVTRGCNPPGNDRFCPDQAVNRQEMASFLARALRLQP